MKNMNVNAMVVGLVALLAGCAPEPWVELPRWQLVNTCEDNQTACIPEEWHRSQRSFCEDRYDLAVEAGCVREFQTLHVCIADNFVACGTPVCEAEGAALEECIQTYWRAEDERLGF